MQGGGDVEEPERQYTHMAKIITIWVYLNLTYQVSACQY